MELVTKENGKISLMIKNFIGSKVPTLGRGRVFKSGLMDLCTRAGGRITKPMARVGLSMQMETFMMAIGRMTRLMVMEFTLILMAQDTKVHGEKTSNMEEAWKHGPMELATRVTMSMERSMAVESLHGQMDLHMKANS
jgi:hypothetical protein